MIRSMTGYGHGAADGPGVRVIVDVRSVNNRFADLRLRLPDAAVSLEQDVRRKVLGRIRRGRVEVDFTFERAPGAAATTVNRPLVDDVVAAARELSRAYGIPGTLDLTAILRIPGVVQLGGAAYDLDEGGRVALEAALDAALDAHDSERCREGEALRADLVARFLRMDALVAAVAARAAEVPAAARRKLEERLQALTAGLALDPARLAQEAAFLADRADVTEEIVRLRGHLAQARSMLEHPDGETVGKRLDFLLQEIGRETNTIGSKSADLEISRRALDLKAEAEKVREQIQNLE
jgi:uncharacterized protein (TIGR00255 family)